MFILFIAAQAFGAGAKPPRRMETPTERMPG